MNCFLLTTNGVHNMYTDFTDDLEKMFDFCLLSKEKFLESYSYLTEIEYDLTKQKINEVNVCTDI